MHRNGFRDGWFRSLTADEAPDFAAHLKRLPDDCVRRRFLRQMRPADLDTHARRALAAGEVLGWYRNGVLRGVAELYASRGTAEAAFSVEPDWRGRGIGQALLSLVLRRARNRGCRSLIVMTTRDNAPMITIALRQGARLEREGTEVVGRFDLEPATLGSRLADVTEEEAAVARTLAGQWGRMAAAWLPG